MNKKTAKKKKTTKKVAKKVEPKIAKKLSKKVAPKVANDSRDKRNRDAGLEPIAPKFYVLATEKAKASDAIKKALKPFLDRAKKHKAKQEA